MKTNYVETIVTIDDILNKDKFIIPHFQRSVVWNTNRRKEFLKNVRAGEPFGIILIRSNNGKYELIDGLQRISTIKDYIKNPYKYLDASDIEIEPINILIRRNCELQGLAIDEKYISSINEKYRNKVFECCSKGELNFQMISTLREEFGLTVSGEIDILINNIYSSFTKSLEIDSLRIMAIDYTGPAENIPNVFYNLNTGGVSLSKYETYAALWSDKFYKVEDNEIIAVIHEKYTKLEEDSDIEVDYSEEALTTKGITLFEYCYALSGILRNRYENIIGSNSKSTDPTGFEILALLLTNSVNHADKLHGMLEDASPEFLVELKKIILNSMDVIKNSLEYVIHGMNDKYFTSDSTYLIYHMLVSFIREYYDIDYKNTIIHKKSSPLKKKDFEKYLHLHYVYSYMTEFWKENRQVSDLIRELDDDTRRQKYWHTISYAEWETALVDKFIPSQQSCSVNIPLKNKLFINFFTKLKIRANPTYRQYFIADGNDEKAYPLDFEHIVPKKIIEKHISDLAPHKKKLIPISAVGNLCYLSVRDNRSKREKSLYEFTESRPAYATEKDFLDCIAYPSASEINFFNYDNHPFKEAYSAFLDARHNQLTNEFLELVKKFCLN